MTGRKHPPRTIPTALIGPPIAGISAPPSRVGPAVTRRSRPKVWRICHPAGLQLRVLANFCVKQITASVMLFGLPDATHEVGTRLMRAVSAQRAAVSPFT